MSFEVRSIVRYPVKGLSPEPLTEAALAPGRSIAGDRGYALAHGTRARAGAEMEWTEKNAFLMLARHPKLAQLQTEFDEPAGVLTIRRGGKQVARGKITDRVGRSMIEEFFAAFMGQETHGKPRLVRAFEGQAFSDISTPVVSIVGLASLRDVERVANGPVDPRRVRANVYIEGGGAWDEFAWVDKEVTIGDARLRVIARTSRCPATTVNPNTAERDLNLPLILQRGFGHADCGVYAEVIGAGTVRPGDPVRVLG